MPIADHRSTRAGRYRISNRSLSLAPSSSCHGSEATARLPQGVAIDKTHQVGAPHRAIDSGVLDSSPTWCLDAVLMPMQGDLHRLRTVISIQDSARRRIARMPEPAFADDLGQEDDGVVRVVLHECCEVRRVVSFHRSSDSLPGPRSVRPAPGVRRAAGWQWHRSNETRQQARFTLRIELSFSNRRSKLEIGQFDPIYRLLRGSVSLNRRGRVRTGFAHLIASPYLSILSISCAPPMIATSTCEPIFGGFS